MLHVIVSVLLFFCVHSIEAVNIFGKPVEPCEFRDSVNISSGFEDRDGNYLHDNTVYPRGSFATYNYTIEKFTNKKVSVDPHVRGCICTLKTCIRFCCRTNEGCENITKFVVPTKNGKEEIDIVESNYGVLFESPCNQMYALDPEEYPSDKWYFSVSIQSYFWSF